MRAAGSGTETDWHGIEIHIRMDGYTHFVAVSRHEREKKGGTLGL